MLFCSLIKSLSGCLLSKRLHVFFCVLFEAKAYIAKREKWDSSEVGKTWEETRHNLSFQRLEQQTILANWYLRIVLIPHHYSYYG